MRTELLLALAEILKCKEPVATVKNLIVQQGGFWNQIEASEPKGYSQYKSLER